MGKCNRVEELDLDKRILRVEDEVDVYHGALEEDQPKDDIVRSDALYLKNGVNCSQ